MILDNNNNNNYNNYNNNNTPFGVNNMGLNNNFGNYMNRNVNNNSLQNMYPQQFSQFLKCRPVSSKEEAIATQIDLDGSLWVFTDLGNQKIYTKKVRNDGTSEFNVYNRIEEQPFSFNTSEYVTKNEFNQVIKELLATIQQPNNQNIKQSINSQVPQKF